MSEITSQNSKMSSVTEASILVREIGTSREGPIKAAIAYASRRLGWPYSRTKNIWYAHARRIDSEEMDRLRQLREQVERERAVQAVVGLRQHLADTNPQLHSETVDALDHALRTMGVAFCSEDVPDEGEG